MAEVGISRVLLASLHQGIADVLPMRLEFYENWLNPRGLREGTIGLAPLAAVLSFLRLEGPPYPEVTARAGHYAAEWTVAGLSSGRRALLRGLPLWLRTRVALRLASRMVHESHAGSRAKVRFRKGTATVDVRGSLFCVVRETTPHPLCGFYAAAFERMLYLLSVDNEATVTACRGAGESACRVSIVVRGSVPEPVSMVNP